MVLIGPNVTLRRPSLDDAQSIVKYITEPDVVRYLVPLPNPYTLEDSKEFLTEGIKKSIEKKSSYFVIEHQDQFAGIISASHLDEPFAKFGYWLGKPFWGKGLMTEATTLFVNHTFENYKIHKLSANVYEPNVASARILERIGFVKEGTLRENKFIDGKFWDEYVYGLLRREWER